MLESLFSKQISDNIDSQMYCKMSAYRKCTAARLTSSVWQRIGERSIIKNTWQSCQRTWVKPSTLYNHALKIKKLEAYGFSHMRSYFLERKNRVKVNGVISSWKDQSRGCPRGSSFTPLLWNLVQNDFFVNVHTSNLFMYAGDHQIYFNERRIPQERDRKYITMV